MIGHAGLASEVQLSIRLLADFAYTRPFLQPLPVWNFWYVLILPLCAAVAVVYKSIKCRSMSQVPRQAATITLWILLSFAAAAAALAGVVWLVQEMQ
jgi:hypothetical protein